MSMKISWKDARSDIKEYAERLVCAFRPEREYCHKCGYAVPLVNGTALCADCLPAWVRPGGTWLQHRLTTKKEGA